MVDRNGNLRRKEKKDWFVPDGADLQAEKGHGYQDGKYDTENDNGL